MISHKHKFIFVHIPKSAGSSIGQFFQSGYTGPQVHTETHDVNLYADYYKFTFVRNPWDRWVSEYKWSRPRPGHSPRPWIKHQEPMTFVEYCKKQNLASMYRRRERVHLWTQVDVMEHCLGRVDELSFIGRFENLQEDFNTICDKIGISQIELPHKNKTKHKHYTEYYDDETRQIVAEKYAKDIEYFGYKFGE
jgi:hypothetical protein